MAENSLSLPFSSSAGGIPDKWLLLSQDTLDDPDSNVSLVDIDNMLLHIIMGQSAHSYDTSGCPISITEEGVAFYTAVIYVDHSLDLQYSISSTYGTLGPKIIASVPKNESIIVTDKSNWDLGWIPEEAEFHWESGTYNNGILTAPPEITLSGSTLSFSYPVWGILRIVGTAVVDKYELVIQGREGYRLENFNSSVSAVYTDDNGEEVEEILDLKVPQCVEDILSTCPEDPTDLSHWGDPVNQTGHFVHIWYDACQGHVIKIERSAYDANR